MGSKLSIDSGFTRTGTPLTYKTVTSSGPISNGKPSPAEAIWLGSKLSIDSGLTSTGTPFTYKTETSSGPISSGRPRPAEAI